MAAPAAAAQSQRFPDVPTGHYAFEAVEWAAEAGVTRGYGDGTFKPQQPLRRWHAVVFMERYYDEILGADESPAFTRGDMMVLLKAINDGASDGGDAAGPSSDEAAGQRFPDVPTGHYAFEAVEWAAEAGVTRGYGDGTFKPQQPLRRWHAVVFMERYYDEILGADESPAFTRGDMMVLLKAINDGAGSEPISAPLTRCIEAGLPLSGRASVLEGHPGEGRYQPVVAGGAGACDDIKAWWDELRAAEADRIAGGQYPCEYPAAYEYDWLRPDWNGPPHVAGCWPQVLIPGAADDDPEQEAARLAYNSGYHTLPPNAPVLVEALYDCYHEALEGPPPGWEAPHEGAGWATLLLCHNVMQIFGNPVRELGVSPECAARQFSDRIQEFRTRPPRTSDSGAYAGDHSWANCETDASRLIGAGFATFAERCAAVLTASAGPKTDHLAAHHGVTVEQLVAFLDTIICQDATKETLRQYPQYYGDFVADWTPPEDSICYDAALLGAARAAVRQEWIRVLYC